MSRDAARRRRDLLPAALVIAGSDPSGGAGIQADVKAFTVIGVYCGAAITALTSQNTLGVSSYLPLPPAFVKQQVLEVLDDLNVTHIKIGMVGNGEIAEALGEALSAFAGEIIYDPVLKASSGGSLFSPGSHAITMHLLPRVTILTPNIGELEILTGRDCPDARSALAAAQHLFTLAPRLKAVCLKGSHLLPPDKTITDYLIRPAAPAPGQTAAGFEILPMPHPRIVTRNTHGTGCTFASAFTAYLMQTNDFQQAFRSACTFMDRVLRESAPHHIGHGAGPLLHYLFCAKADE